MTPLDPIAESARAAAGRHGTPAYFYDLPTLTSDAVSIRDAFPDPWLRLYSLKANGLPPLLRGLPGLGFGANAVSGGELDLAERAGFDPTWTALEGIGKTPSDLRRAVRRAREGKPLLWVSLESAEEARGLATVARRAGVVVDVLVRLNPTVAPETHRGLAVGAAGSKFGVLPSEFDAVVAAGGGRDGPLRWRGLHVHVGSQLAAVDAWRAAVASTLEVFARVREALPDFDTLDAGSGFPVLPADPGAPDPPAPIDFARAATEALASIAPERRPKRLAIEPGRAIVARSGWLLARVLHVRERKPTQIVLDAGMTELIRPALYGARHPLVALTSDRGRLPAEQGARATLAMVEGPICESTDRFGEATLPPLARGDLVAIGLAGAYASSMSSTYNGRPRPSEIAWDGMDLRLIRRRGTVG